MYPNIERLFGTGFHDIKPGLERITRFLDYVGSPNREIEYILVGGTNGKCSVATGIARILEQNSYKTGLYTSPHLVEVTERFRINGIEISKQRLEDILRFIFEKCDKTGIELSYFELVTAAAFIYFFEERIDIGVLEVGMGGRWDATNVCNPLVSVITNVSYDHTSYLGDTLEKIASEKAEIMQKDGYAVTGAAGVALDTIRTAASERNCTLFVLDEDFSYEKKDDSYFDYHGINLVLKNLKSGLKGLHQISNIVMSVVCAELLSEYYNYKICSLGIAAAVESVSVPGRFEYLRAEPPLIMDGAHNEAAARELVRSIRSIYGDRKFVFLLAMLYDKDHEAFIENIVKISSKIIVTDLEDPRCERKEVVYQKVIKKFNNVEVAEDPVYALEKIISGNDPACITGSLYLLGYLKGKINNEKDGFGL